MIESRIRDLVAEAIGSAVSEGKIQPLDADIAFDVTQPRQREHGDWSVNAALVLQKHVGRPPREVAQLLVDALADTDWVTDVQIAGPGFINFTLSHAWLHDACKLALSQGDTFGSTDIGRSASVLVEFVSINPTGPLHVAHGRNAAIGDAIARLLAFTGWRVEREYYLNDAGTQMRLFLQSVAVRYIEECGGKSEFPEDGYHGDYVRDLAREVKAIVGDDKSHLDMDELSEVMREHAYPIVIGWIRDVLARFEIRFDSWFSERERLHQTGRVTETLDRLKALGVVFEDDGATWLRSTDFGDSRDRVLITTAGRPSYLLGDLAYHLDKAERGYALLVDVMGADHHGQTPSLHAGMKALGVPPEKIEVVLHQFVHLLRGGETVPMSKRTGLAVSLEELLDEVGVDAARYTYLQSSADNTINFDIEAVTRKTLDNPVYYVQYAHARICSILRKASEQGVELTDDVTWAVMTTEAETELMRTIAAFPETILSAAGSRAPHRLTTYAEDLARRFHSFYTECHVMVEDDAVRDARLALVRATRQVLANALSLIGVSAPERMDREDESL